MIVLDTNVFSKSTKPLANPRVVEWFNRQDGRFLYLTAVNLAEVLEGTSILPDGKRKLSLRTLVERQLAEYIKTPILPFDEKAAEVCADLMAYAKAKRYTLPMADAQIAAIAKLHGFAVATRDVDPFIAAGVPVINPWAEP